jgi:hypothetical protein
VRPTSSALPCCLLGKGRASTLRPCSPFSSPARSSQSPSSPRARAAARGHGRDHHCRPTELMVSLVPAATFGCGPSQPHHHLRLASIHPSRALAQAGPVGNHCRSHGRRERSCPSPRSPMCSQARAKPATRPTTSLSTLHKAARRCCRCLRRRHRHSHRRAACARGQAATDRLSLLLGHPRVRAGIVMLALPLSDVAGPSPASYRPASRLPCSLSWEEEGGPRATNWEKYRG